MYMYFDSVFQLFPFVSLCFFQGCGLLNVSQLLTYKVLGTNGFCSGGLTEDHVVYVEKETVAV